MRFISTEDSSGRRVLIAKDRIRQVDVFTDKRGEMYVVVWTGDGEGVSIDGDHAVKLLALLERDSEVI